MHKEIEIELKTHITKSKFNEIKQKFFLDQVPLIQTNTYFDTPDHHLKAKKMALRIRKTPDKQILTLKAKQDALTAFEYSTPYLQDINSTLHNTPQLISELPCNIDELRVIAHFTTHRFLKSFSFGLICLDQTYFENGTSDFELEIELNTHDMLQEAEAWLHTQHITYQEAKPKIARAIAQQPFE